MDGQRQRVGRGRRRKNKTRTDVRPKSEPILIAARRPNSPILQQKRSRHLVVASAAPRAEQRVASDDGALRKEIGDGPMAPPDSQRRRGARIVQLKVPDVDDKTQQRERLLHRLLTSEGRGAISRAANEIRLAGFDFPIEQEFQLQLLEHFDEECARDAIGTLAELLENELPIKRPVFEQRLRRLEEYADEMSTREAAASLRRSLRA